MPSEVKVTGKFLGASKIREVGANKLKVRDFWVDVSGNPDYPNTPELNLSGDLCTLTDGLMKGMEIEVLARLQGNKFRDKDGKEKVFTNIRASKINIISRQSAGSPAPAPAPVAAPAPQGAVGVAGLPTDDNLPF